MLEATQPFADALVASLYDAFPFDADVPFYLELAGRAARDGDGTRAGARGRVLEVGCGTGRLLLPLSAAGHQVVGVDASPPMLALARRKLDRAGIGRDQEGSLLEADMRCFDAGGDFDLAVMAVATFGYLLTREDQAAALTTIARHLRPGGLLALDLLCPRPAWLLEPAGSLRQDVCGTLPDGTLVMRTETVVSSDLSAQLRVTRAAYELVGADGGVTKRVVQWPSRFTYRFEAEHLLERAGFVVEAVRGGYQNEPFTGESRTMLFVARRGPARRYSDG
ncbi:MAG: class I SAM-dependent methyltransferase [Actinomycetota bacterium]|nr:class I SAM-dependent methyltransferase [Actinomycetota bacterium]